MLEEADEEGGGAGGGRDGKETSVGGVQRGLLFGLEGDRKGGSNWWLGGGKSWRGRPVESRRRVGRA